MHMLDSTCDWLLLRLRDTCWVKIVALTPALQLSFETAFDITTASQNLLSCRISWLLVMHREHICS